MTHEDFSLGTLLLTLHYCCSWSKHEESFDFQVRWTAKQDVVMAGACQDNIEAKNVCFLQKEVNVTSLSMQWEEITLGEDTTVSTCDTGMLHSMLSPIYYTKNWKRSWSSVYWCGNVIQRWWRSCCRSPTAQESRLLRQRFRVFWSR